jgi:pyruvate/2-oxoglutarate dehydrogenase complex dihydrolipoamide acyltransferase (E2) component
VQWQVGLGDAVRAGQVVAILEAMKMEHEVRALADGQVHELFFATGETVERGGVLMVTQPVAANALAIEPAPAAQDSVDAEPRSSGAHRPDLQRLIDRHALVLDAARPDGWACKGAHALLRSRGQAVQACPTPVPSLHPLADPTQARFSAAQTPRSCCRPWTCGLCPTCGAGSPRARSTVQVNQCRSYTAGSASGGRCE